MNDNDWQACGDPAAMLDDLGDRFSDRKLRLFAVACCRRVMHLITNPQSRRALEVAEAFALGRATEDDRARAEEQARYASYDDSFFQLLALQAVYHALAHDIRTGRPPQAEGVDPEDAPTEPALGGVRAVLQTLALEAGREAAYGAVPGESEEAQVAHARAVEEAAQAAVLREIVGNPYRPVQLDPFWLAWNDGCVPNLARAMLDDRRWADLPILADALEESGCDSHRLLDHLRGPGPHYPGCWALDLLLGLA